MIDRLLFNIRALLRLEFIKYGISGATAFVCDFTVMVAATELLGIHYLISNVMGYSVGLVVSYTLNVKFVFDHRRYDHDKQREFIYFTTIVFVGLAISEGVVWIVTEYVDLHYTWSKLVSVLFVFLFNYFAKKRLLFTPPKETPAEKAITD